MGKGRRIRREKEMRDFLRKTSAEQGLPVDPEGEVVEIPATVASIREEVQESLREFRLRGCTCNPEVRAEMKADEKIEGSK